MKKVIEPKKRKVAVVKCYGFNCYDDYDEYCSHKILTQHVTEFTEVDETEIHEIRSALRSLNTGEHSYVLIEEVQEVNKFICRTVQEYRDEARRRKEAEEKRRVEEEKQRKNAAEARRVKKLAKDEASLKAAAEKLGLKLIPASVSNT